MYLQSQFLHSDLPSPFSGRGPLEDKGPAWLLAGKSPQSLSGEETLRQALPGSRKGMRKGAAQAACGEELYCLLWDS